MRRRKTMEQKVTGKENVITNLMQLIKKQIYLVNVDDNQKNKDEGK